MGFRVDKKGLRIICNSYEINISLQEVNEELRLET